MKEEKAIVSWISLPGKGCQNVVIRCAKIPFFD